MNQRTAEAMAAKVQRELGTRASRLHVQCMNFYTGERPYWMVTFYLDNYQNLGFSAPYQWAEMRRKYGLEPSGSENQ